MRLSKRVNFNKTNDNNKITLKIMLTFYSKRPKQKKKAQCFLLNTLLLILLTGMFHAKSGIAQTLGINTTGAIPDSSAMLDILSPNRGLLIPRVSLTSTTDTTTIANPAISLLVYNTNAAITGGSGLGYYYYNGTLWMNFLSGTGNSLTTPLIIGGSGTTSSLTYKPTTGVGTTGADHIFKVGNNGATEAMRILNNGNVGIGTTAPTHKLSVLSTSDYRSIIMQSAAQVNVAPSTILSANYLQIGGGEYAVNSYRLIGFGNTVPGTSFYPPAYIGYQEMTVDGSATTGDLIFGTRGSKFNLVATERMRVLANGNVGIGTTAPNIGSVTGTHLTVAGTTATPAVEIYGNFTGVANTPHAALKFWGQNSSSVTSEKARIDARAGTSGTSAGQLVFHTRDVTSLTLTERMRISENGNVGIGTTAPVIPLTVVANSSALGIGITTNSATVAGVAALNFYTQASRGLGSQIVGSNASTGGLIFYTNAGLTESMRMLSNGNVGIGITAPTKKLWVESTTSDAIWLKGNTSGSSPFVASYITAESNISARGRGLFMPSTATEANSSWFVGVPYTGDATGPGFQIGCSSIHTSETAGGPYVTASAKIFIQPSGNTGIGTITPASKLDVEGGIAIGATYSGTTAAPTNGAIIEGNVGIGTSSPNSPLEVKSSARVSYTSSSGGTLILSGNSDGSTTINANAYTGTPLLKFTQSSGAVTMAIDNSGNVGIATTTPNSTLQVNGALSLPLVTPSTGNYSVNATDYTINVTIINSLITLPSAVGITGRIYFIKANGYTTTILTTSSQTIDGAAPPSIANGTGLMVQSDGSNWIKIN